MQKTIIFIIPNLDSGGAERIVTTLANHLPRDLFVPKIMLMQREGAYLELVRSDVEIVDLKVPRIRKSLFPILREIRKRKPEIVFSGFGEVNAYLSLFLNFFPKTQFIARETNVVSNHVTRKEIRFFYQFYNNYKKIICQSDDMLEDLMRNFKIKSEKLVKINNPVDFQLIDKNLANTKRPDEYRSGWKNVVAIGNLSSRKGFDNLLKVFSFLKQKEILLHIVGDGAEREKFVNESVELGLKNVIFHGRQQNPFPYLKYADLFVLSSRYEGFPNVLLEAGACGTFSLANDCPGGIREIIQSGINGEVLAIENHQEFAKKIEALLSSPHDEKAIINSIKSRFSKEIILEKYVETLVDI